MSQTPKQALQQMVKEEASLVEAHKAIVRSVEQRAADGVLLAEDAIVRLDPELHRLMLVHLDCKLALSRANLMVAEYCATKVEPTK